MRPRPDAAENNPLHFPPLPASGFNEAAARCRGKHTGWVAEGAAAASLQ